MADQPTRPRRRPIDALFGDSDAPALPSYAVDPPQPVTTVSPPPVAPRPPEPASAMPASRPEPSEPVPAAPVPPPPPPVEPALPDIPTFVPPVDPGTPTYAASSPNFQAPTYVGAPAPAVQLPAAVALPETDSYFSYIPGTIRQLYEEVNTHLLDSPVVGEQCMKLLLQSRDAYLRQDYATAEYCLESVDVRLKRSLRSMQMSRSPVIWLLWIWQLGALAVFGLVIAVSYIPALTLFGVPVASELLTLIRAVGWGGIGGVIGAFYNLPWFIQFRAYDPAYNTNYFVRPLLGVLIGAVLFLLSQAGVIAGNAFLPALPGSSGATQIPIGSIFLYLFAVLAGFKQEYVLEFLDNILKALFRIPSLPEELESSVPGSKR